MKVLVALSALLVLGAAQLTPYGYPYAAYNQFGYYPSVYNNYVPTPVATPVARSSQYHSQDELGQFNYGYADGLSVKNEYRRYDGATVGSYSYLDANGKVQTVSYTADDVNGFQVKATNLPVAPVANLESPVFNGVGPEPVQDTAEVAAAKAEFNQLYAEAAAAAEAAPDNDGEEKSERRRRSAVLLPALAKATFKTASLDTVEADTPADTTLLEVKEKEHEVYVPAPITYAAPAFHYAAPAFHYAAPAVTYVTPEVKKAEVKQVAAPITYAAPFFHYASPSITYTTPVVKEVEVKHVVNPITYAAPHLPLTYGLNPYGFGAPLIYNFDAKQETDAKDSSEEVAVEPVERRRRSAVLLPAVAKATIKTASLDKVEADTPADTTLLELKEKEHDVYVPAPITYAAPAFHYAAPAVTYVTPEVKKVEVKHVAAPITYAAPFFHYASPAITYTTPVVKEVEVKHVVNPITYAAPHFPLTYGLNPYGFGAPLIYNFDAKQETDAKDSSEEVAV